MRSSCSSVALVRAQMSEMKVQMALQVLETDVGPVQGGESELTRDQRSVGSLCGQVLIEGVMVVELWE